MTTMDQATELELRRLLNDREVREALRQQINDIKRVVVGKTMKDDNRLEIQLEREALGTITRKPTLRRTRLFRDVAPRQSNTALTAEVVTKAWVKYEEGHSVRAIAGDLFLVLGYASVESCAMRLTAKFKERGYELRPRRGT